MSCTYGLLPFLRVGSCNPSGLRFLEEFLFTVNTLLLLFLFFFYKRERQIDESQATVQVWNRFREDNQTGLERTWLNQKYTVAQNSKSLHVFPSRCSQTFLVLDLDLLRCLTWSRVEILLISVITDKFFFSDSHFQEIFSSG